MTRFIALSVSAAALLAAAAAAGGEVPLQNLPGADFKPGQLKLPLAVTERSGVERKAAVVSSGVPFPAGFLAAGDEKKLGVVDKDGKPVVSQAAVMVKWHSPAYDDSAQWVLVSFVADVPANGTSTYYLTDDGKAAAAAPASPLKMRKDDKAITIDTGAASFVVPLAGEALISSASIGGKPVIGGAGLRGVITTGDWPERNLKAGAKHAASHDPAGVTVEESGAARVVVCIKGRHKPGDKDGRLYRFTARLYFEVNSGGQSAVRVVYSIDNSELDAKLNGGWRHIYTRPIKDASLLAELAIGDAGQPKTAALAESKTAPVSSDQGLTVYQDSSGGEKWQNLGGGNYEGWISAYTKGQTVRGVTFRGYKVLDGGPGGKELAAGNANPGVMDVSNGQVGLTAALRNFRVEHPHALAGSAKGLRVGLFPGLAGEFSEPFHLNPGQRKSWDVRLTLHGAEPADLAKAFAIQDALLLFRPEPSWMVRAGAAGAWPYGLALAKDAKGGQHPLRRDNSKLDGINTGWDWYGWVSGWNSGGGHWNEETVLAPWVLWGDGANFDHAEACALWAADLTAINFDHPDISALWLWLMSWNDKEPRIQHVTYPGWYNRDTWGLPDSGHMGMLMWPEYYFVTGDMRAREAIEHLGNRARAMLWQYNHDDKADGTGPMATPVNWCRKQDPDADPNFRLATRYVGWPLFDLADYYRFIGDPQILAECRTVARAFRNTARYSPIGFMTLDIEPRGGTRQLYAFQGPFEKYRDLSASACYAHFQEGLMVTGLIEYYLMSRDVEALDAMVGFADLMTHHCMLRDPQGKRAGWTYAFGDYWGPYTWDDAGGRGVTFHVSNYTVTEGLGWIAQFTGRSDFIELLKDAVAASGGGFGEAAAMQAVMHPHVNAAAPAAVTDLKAEALLDSSKVKLTWTAPGGSGQGARAVRYQVKYSTAKIVERVKGWPDRAEPLPTNKTEWEAGAAAFNARQRAFWAASNAPGWPAPAAPQPAGAAGAAQTMTIEGLAPGTYHFAIKGWNDSDNLGELSNVVEATVK